MRYRRNIVFSFFSSFFAYFFPKSLLSEIALGACSFLKNGYCIPLLFLYLFYVLSSVTSARFCCLNVLWFLRFSLTINSISSLLLCLLISSFLRHLYIAGEYFKIKQKNVLLSTFTCNSQFSILEPLSPLLDPTLQYNITLLRHIISI